MSYDLSVIIPVFNEESTVIQLLQKLTLAPALKKFSLQFIVVDDGSTDRTGQLLQNFGLREDPRFVWLKHSKNLGKGSAIRTGLKHALGAYTIIQDADLEYDPNDIAKLLECAIEQNLPVVYGSRNLNPATARGGFSFYWGGRFLSALVNLLFAQKITDEPTCYKLFSASLLKSLSLTCSGFEFCPEVTALVSLKGIKIKELPIDYHPRGAKAGKKINTTTDGLSAIWTLFRLRFDSNKDWLLAAALFAFVFLWYMATWQNIFMGYEQETARSALEMFSGTFQIFRAGVGSVLMYLPFVGLAEILNLKNSLAFLSIVPIFYSAASAVVLYLICDNLTKRKSASLIFALLVSVGSLMWPYSRIGMEYQAMLCLAIVLLSLLHWRKTLLLPLLPGAALALLALSKSYGIIFTIPALIFVFLELLKLRQTRRLFQFKFLGALLAPPALALVATWAINFIIFGRLAGAYNLDQEFQVWTWWEGFWGVLFSPGKSILLYSPLLILALWFWKKFWQKERSTGVFILSAFALLFLITAPFSFWTDETLSVRKLMPIIPLLHLPLIYAFEAYEWNRTKKIAFSAFFLAVFYIQFINTLYPYWLGLVMFRPYNLDTLSAIRYNPKLSALPLNHYLFKSFLSKKITGSSDTFNYNERSWMRCCTGKPEGDPFLAKIKIPLAEYDRPNLYLLAKENKKRKIFAVLGSFGLILTGGFLTANIINRRKRERINLLENELK